MKNKKLLIYGNGEMAQLMYHYFTHDSDYEVVAFTADEEYMTETTLCGLDMIPFASVEERYPPGSTEMFVAIGYARMRNRKVMYEKAKSKGYSLANYISSQAHLSPGVRIGENNAFLSGVIVEPFCEIGNNNMFNSGVTVCHHTVVKDHSFLAARVLIGGRCLINDGCFFGFGCVVLQYKTMEQESLVGANALLLSDTRAYGRYLGSPARLVGSHQTSGMIIEN